MPILIAGKKLSERKRSRQLDADTLLAADPRLKAISEEFADSQVRVVEPNRVLYVGQREYAVLSGDDPEVRVVGSDDATTCHICVFVHPVTKVVALCHFDGCTTEQAINDITAAIWDLSKTEEKNDIDVYLCGGFLDGRDTSSQLASEILEVLHNHRVNFQIRLAAMAPVSDELRQNGSHFPKIYGAGYDLARGELFKAVFVDRGPDEVVRCARHVAGDERNLNIYDPVRHQVVIPCMTFSPDLNLSWMLEMPDSFFRKSCSTSPEQEPPHFERHFRAGVAFIDAHPRPERSFFHGKARKYSMSSEGRWTLMAE